MYFVRPALTPGTPQIGRKWGPGPRYRRTAVGNHCISKSGSGTGWTPSGCPNQNADFQYKMPPKGPPRQRGRSDDENPQKRSLEPAERRTRRTNHTKNEGDEDDKDGSGRGRGGGNDKESYNATKSINSYGLGPSKAPSPMNSYGLGPSMAPNPIQIMFGFCLSFFETCFRKETYPTFA